VPVWVPLPDFVVEALDTFEPMNKTYYFWSGASGKDGVARTYMNRIFKPAGVPNGHAHRFRDTFAVELLMSGVPPERVSILLGHGSVKVTEKRYSPWVLARQEQLEADVKRTWGRDPLALAQTKGTPKVHGIQGTVNSIKTNVLMLAVRVGFEPTEPVKVQRFSRPPDSTALAPHRIGLP